MSDVSATTGTTSSTPTATLPSTYVASQSGTTSQDALNGVNPDTFLQLLVSELQNQDPDNPTDPSQFLSQTASFEEVEELNTLQTSISSMITSQQQSSATSMLGMQVSGSDSSGKTVSGIVTGVQFDSSGPVLTVGSGTLPYSSVTSVAIPDDSSDSNSTDINQSNGTSS
ncbi:MAG TPA: flagellar hook capping FlgD N-terminal domain-containing protein [Acidimicrobiales bacterium]|nr:flagellar hook capping FlgD N-terminal domain-containing protein [Acidimicrobiales bacterium]